MIEVEGMEQIQRKFSELSALVEDTTPMMKEIGNTTKNRIEENFDEQGYYGQKWAPLKDAGAGYDKKRVGKRGKPLKRFLDYVANRRVLYRSGHLANDWTVQAKANEVVIGTNAWYGIFHQFKTKNDTLPVRKFIPIDEHGVVDPRMSVEIQNLIESKIKKITG